MNNEKMYIDSYKKFAGIMNYCIPEPWSEAVLFVERSDHGSYTEYLFKAKSDQQYHSANVLPKGADQNEYFGRILKSLDVIGDTAFKMRAQQAADGAGS